MTQLLVVAHPEDLITEFLSVLSIDEPLTVLIAAGGRSLTLPAGGFDARRDAVTALLASDPGTAELTGDEVPGAVAGASLIWTHNPADERQPRARLAARIGDAAAGEVRYSTGVSASLKFVAPHAVPLTGERIAEKLALLTEYARPLIEGAGGPRGIALAAVADCERFFAATPRQARQLYALRHGQDPGAGLAAEPWDFTTSGYERDRLAATAAWVRRWADPSTGVLSELGACEGALTELLLADGYEVAAYEPDDQFRAGLRRALGQHPGLTIGPQTLEELATGGPSAGPFLLAEMLYYLPDPSIADKLPTDELFISVSPIAQRLRVAPWLDGSEVWELAEVVDLVAPRIELVCGGIAYQRKAGSRGLYARRR